MSSNGKIAIALIAGLIVGSLFTTVAFAGVTIAHRAFRNVVAQPGYDGNGFGMMGQGPDGYGMMGRSLQQRDTTNGDTMRQYMGRYHRGADGNNDLDAMHFKMLGGSRRSPTRGPDGYSGLCY